MGQDTQGMSPGPARRGANDYRVSLTWLGEPHGDYTGGNFGRQFSFDNRDRFYEFHVPRGYQPGKPLPVILLLHGGGGNPALTRFQSGMDAIADREGFIAVYPAGTGPRFPDRQLFWNSGRPLRNPEQAQVNDVAFISAVLDDLAKYFPVDERQTFATGISNGAQMCYRLAVELPGRIAAIGPIAGHFAAEEFHDLPDHPISIIHFHGQLDPMARVDGTPPPQEGGFFLPYRIKPLSEMIESWARFNGCSLEPETTTVGKAKCLRFTGGRDNSEVVLWLLQDGGHTWPGGKSTQVEQRMLRVGNVNQDISASKLMWEFFKRHQLP